MHSQAPPAVSLYLLFLYNAVSHMFLSHYPKKLYPKVFFHKPFKKEKRRFAEVGHNESLMAPFLILKISNTDTASCCAINNLILSS